MRIRFLLFALSFSIGYFLLAAGCQTEKHTSYAIESTTLATYLADQHSFKIEGHDSLYLLVSPGKGCMNCNEKVILKYTELKSLGNIYLVTTSLSAFRPEIQDLINSHPEILIDKQRNIERLNIGIGGPAIIAVKEGQITQIHNLTPQNIEETFASLNLVSTQKQSP